MEDSANYHSGRRNNLPLPQKQTSVLVNSAKEKVLRSVNLSCWSESGRSERCFDI